MAPRPASVNATSTPWSTTAADRAVPLTRQAIVAVAVGQATELGLEAVSLRSLASALGVTPMAIYRHVRDKDDVVAAVVDEQLARAGVPRLRGGDWRGWLERMAGSLRRLLREEPVALGLFTRQPVTTPAARRRLAAAIDALGRVGFDPDAAVHAYAAVHTYTIGFSALEAGRRTAPEPTAELDGPGDPLSDAIRGFVDDDQFRRGLRALIAGLAPGAP